MTEINLQKSLEDLVEMERHFNEGRELANRLAKDLGMPVHDEHLLGQLNEIQMKLEGELHLRFSIAKYRRRT